MTGDALVTVLAAGAAGLGLGFGLVMGALVARSLRKLMRDECDRDT